LLGLELSHKTWGCLDEVPCRDSLEVLVGELFSLVALVVEVLGKLLLHHGELEVELYKPSEFDLIFRKGLGHVVEHPVDFQVVVYLGVVLLCFLHEGGEHHS
jgi:hypothetical protein